VPTDSTDAPKEDITILETVVFVNPFETDLKAYYDEKKEKETGALFACFPSTKVQILTPLAFERGLTSGHQTLLELLSN